MSKLEDIVHKKNRALRTAEMFVRSLKPKTLDTLHAEQQMALEDLYQDLWDAEQADTEELK